MNFRDDVEEKIKSGVYKLTTNRGRHSPIWKMYAVIEKEDGSLVDGLVYCRKCKKLLKFDGKRSSNLNRHNCFYKSSLRESDSDREEFKNIAFASLSDKELHNDIANKLKSGEYTTVHRPKGKSQIWCVFERICRRSDGSIVEGLVHCGACKKLYKYDGSLTSNLCRHKCVLEWKQQEATTPKKSRLDEDYGLSLSSTLTEESTCSSHNMSMEREEEKEDGGGTNFSFEMDLIQKNIESKIQSGIYKLTDSQMTTSPIWSAFGFITKDDGSILEGLVCCRQCKIVLKYDGTTLDHLNRHKCYTSLDSVETNLDLVKEEFINDYSFTEFSEFRPNRPIEIKEEETPIQGATYTCLTNSLDECLSTLNNIDQYQITVLNDPYASVCVKQEDTTELKSMSSAYGGEDNDDTTYSSVAQDNNYESINSPTNEADKSLNHKDKSAHARQIIEENIRTGVYKLIDKQNVRSTIWQMFALVVKEDGTIFDPWVYCRRCKKILKNGEKSSSNLNRHPCCANTLKKINDEDKHLVINGCAKWLIEDCRLPRVVEGAGFRKLINIFIQFGARYGLDLDIDDFMPDSVTVCQYINQMADEKKLIFKSKLDELTRNACSVSIDLWPDNNLKKHFLNATLHFSKNYDLFEVNLGIASMDFSNTNKETIRNKLDSLLQDYGIDQCKNLIYISEPLTNIAEALEGTTRLNCSSYLFAQVLDTAIENTPELEEIIDVSQRIVNYFKKSSGETTLKFGGVTRCQSKYDLFKLISENWTTVNAAWSSALEGLEISPELIKSFQSLVDLCEKCELIFKRLQETHLPSLCFVIPCINRLKLICEATANDGPEIKILKDNLLKYLEEIWVSKITIWHKTAYFLYPPTNQEQEKHLNEIKDFCIKQMKALTATTTPPEEDKEIPATASKTSGDGKGDSIKQARAEIDFFFPNIPKRSGTVNHINNAEDELRRYCREDVIIDENFDACEWWRSNSSSYPQLSRLFSQMLAIPASTSGAERILLMNSTILDEKRPDATPKSVDNILFLNSMGQNEL